MSNSPPEQPVAPTIKEDQVEQSSGHLATDAPGALMYTKYVGLEMIVYPIDESRLESLSMLTTGVTLFFSIGTGAAMFALGLARDLAIVLEKDVPSGTRGMAGLIYWICGIVVLGSYGIGGLLVLKRRGILKSIKKKSVPLSKSSSN